MSQIKLRVNGKTHRFDIDPSTPLLWVLRDHLGLTGTKYGCGIAQCGACTVHLNGGAVRSCQVPIEHLGGADIVTIEGLSLSGDHVLQKLWVEMNVPQCGYCQAGQIMQAAALLATSKNPSEDEINSAMSGNICRCGCYQRITAAIKAAATGA